MSHPAGQFLAQLALAAAKRGDAAAADKIELEHIRQRQQFVALRDGRRVQGAPRRLLRGYGKAGLLAVEWGIIDGTTVYVDIDGKEIADDSQAQDQADLW